MKLAFGKALYDKFYYQPDEYLKIYKNDEKIGFILPISFQYNDYYIESGIYSNPDRLLIDKINFNSCIDLLGATRETYLEVLLDNCGDLLLIYDKNYKLVFHN